MSRLKKLLVLTCALALALSLCVISASACTQIFVGADRSADDSPLMARSEDYSNDRSKIFIVSEAGHFKAGEEYVACTQGGYTFFTYTMTHDSYSFTTFSEDYLLGVCPECGEEIAHYNFTEHGTNEKGVTVSGTETLSANQAVKEIDPNPEEGIEESDMPTILLSEASTAREGVEILLNIYKTSGARGADGIMIADQNEIWYVENTTGHQYIAIRLSTDLIFVNPNMSVIGLIDLDDTENVIASEGLIATAQAAGTFVGNAEENQINFRASYASASIGERLVNGLNYLNSAYSYTTDTITDDDFTISNVRDGEIVPFWTAIEADRPLTVDDIVYFYKVDGIGHARNVDTTIYQIYPEGEPETSIVEWIAMDDCKYNVFLPYYPMLTTDTYAAFQKGTGLKEFVTEEPVDADGYYATSVTRWTEEGRVSEDGYVIYPEGWRDSYEWMFNAISNHLRSVDNSGEELVLAAFEALQDRIYEQWDLLKAGLSDAQDPAAYVTECEAAMADEAFDLATVLYRYLSEDLGTLVTADSALAALDLPGDLVTVINDVYTDDWFVEEVGSCVASGLFTGIAVEDASVTFAPNDGMTRGMLVTILWRAMGEPTAQAPASFEDVAADAWYADAVAWAAEQGIVNGYSAQAFGPDDLITREQMLAVMYRFAKYLELDVSVGEDTNILDYEDVFDISEYAIPAVQWAAGSGLLHTEAAGYVAPAGTAARAEAAVILWNLVGA